MVLLCLLAVRCYGCCCCRAAGAGLQSLFPWRVTLLAASCCCGALLVCPGPRLCPWLSLLLLVYRPPVGPRPSPCCLSLGMP